MNVAVTGGGSGIGRAVAEHFAIDVRRLGVGRIAGDADRAARRDYHERTSGRS